MTEYANVLPIKTFSRQYFNSAATTDTKEEGKLPGMEDVDIWDPDMFPDTGLWLPGLGDTAPSQWRPVS